MRVTVALAERSDALGVALRERDAVRELVAAAGGVYAHRRPDTTGSPAKPPSWMKKKRDTTLLATTVDASGLSPHDCPA